MSTSTNPGIVTLTVTRDAAHFIIDCVADRPYKQVAPLLRELEAQVQVQLNTAPQDSSEPAQTVEAAAAPDASKPEQAE